MPPPITEAEAEADLARNPKTALVATLRQCPVLDTEPKGPLQASSLRRRINQRDWADAASELRR